MGVFLFLKFADKMFQSVDNLRYQWTPAAAYSMRCSLLSHTAVCGRCPFIAEDQCHAASCLVTNLHCKRLLLGCVVPHVHSTSSVAVLIETKSRRAPFAFTFLPNAWHVCIPG